MSNRAKILLVEDASIEAEDLRETLTKLGYDVEMVLNAGEKLISKAGEANPELILIDISLAGNVDGIEAIEKIRVCHDIPVIYLTSHTDAEIFNRSITTDPFAFLLKPFDSNSLYYSIELALAKHRFEKHLRGSEKSYRTLSKANGGAIMNIEKNGMISMVNDEFERSTGYTWKEVDNRMRWSNIMVGKQLIMKEEPRNIQSPSSAGMVPEFQVTLAGKNRRAKSIYAKLKRIHSTGQRIISMMDITRIKRAEIALHRRNNIIKKINLELQKELAKRENQGKQLKHEATHDYLTGLPTRALLFDRLEQALAYDGRHNNHLLALMVLDVDDFKAINDTFGHAGGDIILKEVAARLHQCMRQYDTVSRFGGDEFVIIINDMPDLHNVVKFIEKLQGVFQLPFQISDQSVHITSSIGISVAPFHGTTAEELLKKADSAMYQAKKQGKNAFFFYSDEMNIKADARGLMIENMRLALERDEFVPYYQPRLNTATGRITGMEALMRWQPKGASLIYPADFLYLLEESGLIVPVEQRLLATVCRQCKKWQDAGMPFLRVAVKMSARQFRQERLPQLMERTLCDSHLDPQCLEIELSENIIMHNVAESIRKLKELKDIGVTLSIDNFGTGFTSLNYLSKLPIDELKIDKSLISGITALTSNATVVSATIAMGHNLGKNIVAEGVESQEQFLFLAQHKCEEVQGYLFSAPLPSQTFEEMIRQNTSLYL